MRQRKHLANLYVIIVLISIGFLDSLDKPQSFRSIETASDRIRQDITDELNQFGMTVFSRFGGIDGFVNSALAQIGRGGAVSVEWVVSDSMSGVEPHGGSTKGN